VNVLITGGAGFIGRHVTEHLHRSGHWVRWLDTLDPQIHDTEVAHRPDYCSQADEMILGDVRVRDDWRRALHGIDAVIHFAAQTGTGQSMYRIAYYTDVNVGGTALLWDILTNESTSIRKVIVASSRSIYGEGAYVCAGECDLVVPAPRLKARLEAGQWEPNCPTCGGSAQSIATPEDSVPRPASLYASTKLTQEQMSLVMGQALDIPTVAFRFQNVFGPGQSLRNPYTGIISIFSNQMRQALPIDIYEDGNETRDFIFVGDVADICVRALTLDCLTALLNVGSGQPTKVADLASTLRLLWNSASVITVTGHYRVGDIRHNCADLSRLRQTWPDWQPTPLAEGLSKFVDWARGQSVFEDRTYIAAAELKTRNL
jgi:dTDP-L-rhamnose 4-epimerase